MKTKTTTYTTELVNDKQLHDFVTDTLGYCDMHNADYAGIILLDPGTILDMWHERLVDKEQELDENLTTQDLEKFTTAHLVEKHSPELVGLFDELKECESQNIQILF